MEHQIPTDLVSFGGPPSTSDPDRLSAVKAHVAKMNALIEDAKATEILRPTHIPYPYP